MDVTILLGTVCRIVSFKYASILVLLFFILAGCGSDDGAGQAERKAPGTPSTTATTTQATSPTGSTPTATTAAAPTTTEAEDASADPPPPMAPDNVRPGPVDGVWEAPDGTYYAASCSTLEANGLMNLVAHRAVCIEDTFDDDED